MDQPDAEHPLVAVDDVLITAELSRRPVREPDYAAENRALRALAEEMTSGQPERVLQAAAEWAMQLCRADSAGISVLEPGGQNGIFRWHAATGAFAPNLHGTMPRDASPCGTVIARQEVLLFKEGERFFPALRGVEPRIYENLLAPWTVNGEPVGTVWAIQHTPDRNFDAEDARLLASLARFASAAHQMGTALQSAQLELERKVEERTKNLRDSGEQFRTVVEGARDYAIYTTDPEGTVLDWYPGAELLFGYAAAEIKGRPADILYTPEDQAAGEAAKELQQARAEGSAPDVRWHIRKDGRRVFIEGHTTALRNAEGHISGFLKIGQDVTARVKADQSFTRLFEASPALLLILKPDAPRFTITEVNDAYLVATMRKREEVVGRGIFEAFPDNPHDPTIAGVSTLRASLQRVLASHQPDRLLDLRYDVARPDGTLEERWWSPVNSPVLDENGGVEAIIHNANDVTEEHRARAALRRSEDRQRFLLALGDAMRAQSDAQGVLAAAARLLGERLDASRIMFAEFDEARGIADIFHGWFADGAEPFPAVMRLEDYEGPILNDLRAGRTARVDNASDPALQRPDLAAIAAVGVRALLSVPVLIDGRLRVNVSVHQHEPRHWTDDHVALVEEVAERLWADVVRARAEAALRESEEKYRNLFESIDEGFCVLELVQQNGRTVDYRIMEVNPAVEAQSGLVDPAGKLRTEMVPGDEAPWLETYDEVARTGEAQRFERYHEPTGRWYDVYVKKVEGADPPRIALVFNNITLRKRAEIELRESEERQAFLLKLSDAVRTLAGPADIQGETTRLLREQLNAGWCYYVDWDLNRNIGLVLRDSASEGLPSLAGAHDVSDAPEFLQLLAVGAVLTVRDYASYEQLSTRIRQKFAALGFRSMMVAPLVKEGRLIASMLVGDTEIRDWSASEAALLAETAERTWAAVERARAEAALRDSEERLRQFGEASQDILWIRNADTLQWTYLTPAFETIYGLGRDEALEGDNFRSWLDLILPEDRSQATEAVRRVKAGEHITFDCRIRRPSDGAVRWLRNTDFPIRNAAGDIVLVGGIGHDFTELREAELRLQTLIVGIPQLVWRAVHSGTWTWASPQWTEYTGLSDADSRGLGWLAALYPEDRPTAKQAWVHAIETGGFEVEYRLCQKARQEYRWFQTRATPVRDQAGVVVEWLGTSTDVHELRELQERQQALVAELQHRTRNLMGVVRSIADKSVRSSADLADFQDRFRDRLEALARVQGLLSRLNEHDRVTFDQLIATELVALDGNSERVTMTGPTGIRLRSSTVQTLAMALHELFTNAIKYGALRQRSGLLTINWSLEPPSNGGPPWLHIDWRESGVPMPKSNVGAERRGQGRELIERALPYQLKARTQYKLGADGVHCTISLPVSQTTDLSELTNG